MSRPRLTPEPAPVDKISANLRKPSKNKAQVPERARDRIPAFVERVRRVDRDDRSSWAIAMNEIRYLKTYYQLLYVRRILTVYRNAIRTALGKRHPILRYLRPSNQDAGDVRIAYDDFVYKGHLRLKPINPEFFLQAATDAIARRGGADEFAVTAGLILLTGRRPAEILQSGGFKSVEKQPLRAIFSGQLKTRGAADAQTGPYEIPLLAKFADISAAFTYVRSNPRIRSLKTPEDVNAKTSKELSGTIRAVFGPHFTARELRKVYATIAYELFADDSMSPQAFMAEILGHTPGDIHTASGYLAYYIVGKSQEYRAAIRRGETQQIRDINLLRGLQRSPDDRQKLDDRLAVALKLTRRRSIPKAATTADDQTLHSAPARVREVLRVLSSTQTLLLSTIAHKARKLRKEDDRTLRVLERSQLIRRHISARRSTRALVPSATIELTPLGTAVVAWMDGRTTSTSSRAG